MLDSHVWEALEAHGVTEEHMEMLLRLLLLHKHGTWAWNFQHGSLGQCELRVMFASRRAEVARVGEALLDGASVVR
jgi:hypothetical protein